MLQLRRVDGPEKLSAAAPRHKKPESQASLLHARNKVHKANRCFDMLRSSKGDQADFTVSARGNGARHVSDYTREG